MMPMPVAFSRGLPFHQKGRTTRGGHAPISSFFDASGRTHAHSAVLIRRDETALVSIEYFHVSHSALLAFGRHFLKINHYSFSTIAMVEWPNERSCARRGFLPPLLNQR
jgi:hypothetical protein